MRNLFLILFVVFICTPDKGFSQYNENNCYFISGGKLYNDALHTSPSGGYSAVAACASYTGVPYFYTYPRTGLPETTCYLLGGAYYRVACPLDDFAFPLVIIFGLLGSLFIKRHQFVR